MSKFDSIVQLDPNGRADERTFKESVLQDFWICCVSRYASLMGRREVLTGKAKFGILGDGKEVPQVALARAFNLGDWRSGYYRDQTLMFALGIATVEQYFAQIYADAENDPWSGGRQMNAHFATPMTNDAGEWLSQLDQYNVSSDISPTGGQMARALGLALASSLYKKSEDNEGFELFTDKGSEVCICTIGDASTSEGVFWETMNAAAVMQVPLAVSVWDDGYGISVPKELQTAKGSISVAMEGFKSDGNTNGIDIYTCKAWDYPGLCAMYERGMKRVRETHIPALFHIEECTQPQGHSTSGSHERYKTKERLDWERAMDCLTQMENWMLASGLTTEESIAEIHEKSKEHVKTARTKAWRAYNQPVEEKRRQLEVILTDENLSDISAGALQELKAMLEPALSEIVALAREAYYRAMHQKNNEQLAGLNSWLSTVKRDGHQKYGTKLYADSHSSALSVRIIPPQYAEGEKTINGYQVLNRYFDYIFENNPAVVAFGEDVGQIGDVNQGLAGLQEKYGVNRIFDSGIREWTIVGQAIGLAMRGLRPIAEIQYLDYLVYGLTPLTDDLATLRYRSNGLQQAPAIIRTRGHRLEGIWHSGSPMGMIVSSLRGIYVCVPRNMVQAAGMYNTLLQASDPALVVECLNGYRRKELPPSNIGEYNIPLGSPEILSSGDDVTVVSYGSVLHEIMRAAEILADMDINIEVIDVQTLLPFDLEQTILRSVNKTSRVLFVDEDVPGGTTAYMMREVLEVQGGYQYLDAAPKCVSAAAHRPPYGSDGDYFSKPVAGDVVEAIYQIMHESAPDHYPAKFA